MLSTRRTGPLGIVMVKMDSDGITAGKTLVCKALDATKPCVRCYREIAPGLLQRACAIQLAPIVAKEAVIIVESLMHAWELQVVTRACAGCFLQTAHGQSRGRFATKHQHDMV
jgi:hypothetical protein